MMFHRHEGKPLGVTQISVYSDMSPRDIPVKYKTEVNSVCQKCGEPFRVVYKGTFSSSDFEGATIRQKRFWE